jgi:LCP family protein required for cell wall assembly
VNDPRGGDRPEYKVYRSRRKPFERLSAPGGLDALRERRRGRGDKPPREPGEPREITPGRVLKWVGLAVAGWLLFSLLLFLVSAQLEQGVSERAEDSLTKGGNLLTGSTILVLGSDERSDETREPGSGTGPGRADSIMLLRASFGRVRKLSILRDSAADIPGHGRMKINAAYALGGPALMIETVEQFMGNDLEINHLIEVNFDDFPELIDALGGIDVTAEQRICSAFGNFEKGIEFKQGKNHLDGDRALAFARVRKNTCAVRPEDDRDRAARQQEVLSGIRSRALSPSTFVRLPWVSWQAPKTVRTDMAGPNLMALFADLTTGNQKKTNVLDFSSSQSDVPGAVSISDGDKAAAVDQLLGR